MRCPHCAHVTGVITEKDVSRKPCSSISDTLSAQHCLWCPRHLKNTKPLLKNMLRGQVYKVTFVEENFQRYQYFVPFFPQVWALFRVGWWFACFCSLLAKRCHLPPATSFQLWVIILWARWWEKSDFPSLHCNLDLGIIHHSPSPNSSHRRVSSSKASHNRGTYSTSENNNILSVPV